MFLGVLCAQVSTSRPGGENPSDRPERVQHGHQSGADPAAQRGARERYAGDAPPSLVALSLRKLWFFLRLFWVFTICVGKNLGKYKKDFFFKAKT